MEQPRTTGSTRRRAGLVGLMSAAVGASLLLAFLLLNPGAVQPLSVGTRPGQLAPEFRVVDIDGVAHNMTGYRGRVVLLDFMGVNCAPCRAEMPQLVQAYADLHARGFEVLSIDVGMMGLSASGPSDARNYMETYGASWPIALHGGDGAGAVYGVAQIPQMYVIDGHGVVRARPTVDTSNVPATQIEALVRPLLG